MACWELPQPCKGTLAMSCFLLLQKLPLEQHRDHSGGEPQFTSCSLCMVQEMTVGQSVAGFTT